MPAVVPIIAGLATAATATSAIVVGLGYAAAAIGTIGLITGNEKLTRIAGYVSMAAGVASLATSLSQAASTSAATQATGEAATQVGADAAAQTGAQEAFRATEIAAQNAAEQGATAGLIESAGSQAASTGAQEAFRATEIAAQNASAPSALETFRAAELGNVVSPANEVSAAVDVSQAQQSLNAAKGVTDQFGGSMSNAIKPVESASSWTDRIGKVGSWMEKNKELVKLGGGLINGMGEQASQRDLLREKYRLDEEAELRRRQRYNDSVRGVVVPMSVNSTLPRTPATGGGILQRAR